MAGEKSSEKGGNYYTGLIVGLLVGAALFWMTIQMLIAQRT